MNVMDHLFPVGRPKAIGVVLKVAERCNLACTYCYFFFGGDESYKDKPPIIAASQIEDLADFLATAVDDLGLEFVEIAIHGGEPLLMRKAAFSDMCSILIERLQNKCRLELVVQTNGVLIDEQWLSIFEQYKVGIGLSIDGDKARHDSARVDKKGRGSFDRTMSGWRLAKSAAAAGRIKEPGVLSVIYPNTDPRILRFFHSVLDVKGINFLLPDYTYDTNPFSADDILKLRDVMIGIFSDWRSFGDPRLNVRFVRDAVMAMADEKFRAILLVDKEYHWPYLTLRSDGGVEVEDTLRAVTPVPDPPLNVSRNMLTEVLGSPSWTKIAAESSKTPEACVACRYWDLCKGGPMITRHSRLNGFDNPSIYCSALYGFYEALELHIEASGRLDPRFAEQRRGEFAELSL